MPPTPEFRTVFERLRAILEPYGRRMHVIDDNRTWFSVDMAPEGERNPTTWFAGVRFGKAYVSYYLMAVYVEPSLLDGISPELRRRKQGKSCFNFRTVDEALFTEIAELTRRGYELAAGDAAWGVRKREEHDMAYRTAMSADRKAGRRGS